MSLGKCPSCGGLYDSSRGGVCTACERKMEDILPDLREHVRRNRRTEFTAESIAETLGVSSVLVRRMVAEGLLDICLPDGEQEASSNGRMSRDEAFGRMASQLERRHNLGTNDSPSRNEDIPPEKIVVVRRRKKASMYGQERYRR